MPLFGNTSINITSKTTQKEFNDFVAKVGADQQLRATKILDSDGRHIGYKLYAKKSSKTGGGNFWNADKIRPDKFANARRAVNYMLQKGGNDTNLLAVNEKMMDGLQLKAMAQKDMLVVDRRTDINDLKQVGHRIGQSKEVHGRWNQDGTITLFGAAKSQTMNAKRQNELKTTSEAVLHVMEKATNKNYDVMDKMLDSYFFNNQKSTRTQRAYDKADVPLSGDSFQRRLNAAESAALAHSVESKAKQLAPQFNTIANQLFERPDLGAVLEKQDPMRTTLTTKAQRNNDLTHIANNQFDQVKTKDLFASFQEVAGHAPPLPLNKLAPLAHSPHLAGAVGLYTGHNTYGKKTIFTEPNEQAAIQLRDQIKQNLTPQEIAQLKARVEIMTRMADVYADHRDDPFPDLGNNLQAKHAKSLAVGYSSWLGHSAQDIAVAMGNADDARKATEERIKVRDLMTALVIHKDIIFQEENQQAADPDLGRVVRGGSIDAQSSVPDTENQNVVTIGGDDNESFIPGNVITIGGDDDASSIPDMENENVITIGGDDPELYNFHATLDAWKKLLPTITPNLDTSDLPNGPQDLTDGVEKIIQGLQDLMDQVDAPSGQQLDALQGAITELEENLQRIDLPPHQLNDPLLKLEGQLVGLRQKLESLSPVD